MDISHYTALTDKRFKDIGLDDLQIGPFDPMEEVLVTIDLKNPSARLFALSQLASEIERKFASMDKSHFVRDIAPKGDPDNVLGMRLVCYNPKFGHLRFRINDKISEARSKRGVLAETASQHTPKDVQEMIKAILSRSMDSFKGVRGVKKVAQAELLKPRISVGTPKGDVYKLPRGSNGFDFAAAIHGNLLFKISGLLMLSGLTSMEPAREVDLLAPLEDGRVYIVLTNEKICPKPEWLLFSNTVAASAIRGHLARISDADGSDGRLYLDRLSGIFNVSADDLLHIARKKYHGKLHDKILNEIGVGVINPVFVLAEYIEFRNNRWRSNVRSQRRWRDLEQQGATESEIESEIAKDLDGISKWEVEISVPEKAGSLKDFSEEFGREVGIKIDHIKKHVPGRSGESGKLVMLFDLEDNKISTYEFFVKLVKLNFKYPVRITHPIVRSLKQMRKITGAAVDEEVDRCDGVD